MRLAEESKQEPTFSSALYQNAGKHVSQVQALDKNVHFSSFGIQTACIGTMVVSAAQCTMQTKMDKDYTEHGHLMANEFQ